MSPGAKGSTATDVYSGTSMACTHVSGLVAVLLAEDPSHRHNTTAMKEKLISMAQKIALDKDRAEIGDPGLVVNNGILIRSLYFLEVLYINLEDSWVVGSDNLRHPFPGIIERMETSNIKSLAFSARCSGTSTSSNQGLRLVQILTAPVRFTVSYAGKYVAHTRSEMLEDEPPALGRSGKPVLAGIYLLDARGSL